MANGDSFTDYLASNQWGSLSPAIGKMAREQMPQAQYFDYVQQMPQVGARRSRYAQQAYGDVYNQYQGEVGRSLREGRPAATFEDFLKDDPFTRAYSQLPQYERGVTQTSTNPRTRFIFY
jgi:hypothetical protein